MLREEALKSKRLNGFKLHYQNGCLLKGYGKIVFFIVALVNLTGIKLDNYFLERQLRKNTTGVNEQLMEQYILRRQIELVMKRNFFKVLLKYKKKPSSSPNSLKNI